MRICTQGVRAWAHHIARMSGNAALPVRWAHDAKRDRWLYGQGWTVLRFTGTEIHENLDRCLDEICTLVGVERLNRPQ
ncbi:DUF559 domain-containing protein [Mesorhizobium sp. B3-2-1]|nr:DUF559 domain-containing protein [Mesorhizobium sp. B3-2-1]